MIYKANFEGAKKLLLDYLASGECANPFILAGRSGLGKSVLIEQVRAETDYGFDVFSKDYPMEDEELDNYVGIFSNGTFPRVLEITVGTGHELRKVIKSGLDVVILTPDSDSQSPAMDATRQLESFLKENLKKVADYAGESWDELSKLIQDCVGLILYLYLFQQEAQWATDMLMDALKVQMETKRTLAHRLVTVIMQTKEVFAKELF